MQQTNYELRVGLFALFALIALVWGWGWLKSFSLFHPPQKFIVRFSDVAGLSNNATVNVQGVRVGNVEKITFTDDKLVDVHLKITAETMRVPQGSTVTIQTLGLVGAKYIEVALPETNGGPEPPAIANGSLVQGVDPVRIELVANNIATKLNKVFSKVSAEKTSDAIKNLSSATEKLNQNMDRFAKASDSIASTAEAAHGTALKADKFFQNGSVTFENVSGLAKDLRGTSKKVNKILDDPNFSSDFKEAMRQANETVKTISKTIGEVSSTMQDRSLRSEILEMLGKLNTSTTDIRKSMDTVNKISGDKDLRNDIKEAVRTARDAMQKADTILSDSNFKGDVIQTLSQVKKTALNVDIAARQLRQVLGKRAPLIKLLFGRPGYISDEKLKEELEISK
jgi:phospholipid/cholesterol/gamma-HCH transport system substrate-binding protein